MINFKEMMQQAQQMQFKMQEIQEKLKDIYIEGQSGGGLVKITMSCAGAVSKIEIDPSIVKADDIETLEDMVTAAMNNANDVKDKKIQSETESLMGGLSLPGGGKLPF
jgi:hypothetical protein